LNKPVHPQQSARLQQAGALDTPSAPDGDWYKDFGSFTICGSGAFSEDGVGKGHGAIWDPNRIAAAEELSS
jgi:hypothetical protein